MSEEENKKNLNEEPNDNEIDQVEKNSKENIQVERNNDKEELESKEVEEENENKDNTLKVLEVELEEAKEKILRVLAENENIRKQAEKNRIDVAKYGVQPLARELINVVDNFDRALNSIKEDKEKNTLEGFELIQKEIIGILEKFNIKKIDALGHPFDANLHQAMFEKPTSEFELGVVCEIVQEGYKFHDRLLRPALVGIAKNEDKLENGSKVKDEEILENANKEKLD